MRRLAQESGGFSLPRLHCYGPFQYCAFCLGCADPLDIPHGENLTSPLIQP